jgi:hypothetical protein
MKNISILKESCGFLAIRTTGPQAIKRQNKRNTNTTQNAIPQAIENNPAYSPRD